MLEIRIIRMGSAKYSAIFEMSIKISRELEMEILKKRVTLCYYSSIEDSGEQSILSRQYAVPEFFCVPYRKAKTCSGTKCRKICFWPIS